MIRRPIFIILASFMVVGRKNILAISPMQPLIVSKVNGSKSIS
jgi:hypothetical protein